jgi:hypothetical protein
VRAEVGAGDRVERIRCRGRDAARVGVLDDRDGGLDHVVRGPQRGIRVDVVVVRHLLALQLRRLGDAVAAGARVDRTALVRVLAVAEGREALGLDREVGGEVAVVLQRALGEPRRDGRVVRGRVGERAGGELAALRDRGAALGDRRDDAGVRLRRDDDRDVGVVLGRGAHHGGAADVDLLDHVVADRTGGDGLDERVQVHHDELERRDVELGELTLVILEAQVGEQAAVDLRVQRLHPAVEHLGDPGDGGDVGDGEARFADGRAVEPVETISTPASASAAARTRRSVLSLTETSARLIGTVSRSR